MPHYCSVHDYVVVPRWLSNKLRRAQIYRKASRFFVLPPPFRLQAPSTWCESVCEKLMAIFHEAAAGRPLGSWTLISSKLEAELKVPPKCNLFPLKGCSQVSSLSRLTFTFTYSMINSRLVLFGTRVSGRHDSNQVPNSKLVQHQWSSGISLKMVNGAGTV